MNLLLYHGAQLALLLLLTHSLAMLWRSGLFSFGHTAYSAIGAYACAVLVHFTVRSPETTTGIGQELLWLTMIPGLGLLAGAAAGWISFRLLGHLQGDYFAVATLVATECIVVLAGNIQPLGFEFSVRHASFREAHRTIWYSLVIAVSAGAYLGVWWFSRRLDRSYLGLHLTASRDNEMAAAAAGVDVTAVRSLVFTIMAGIAGLSGGLFLYFTGGIVPGDFSFVSGLILIICVVLGRSRLMSTALVTCAVYAVKEFLTLRAFGWFGDAGGTFLAEWKETLLAILLLIPVSLWPLFKKVVALRPATRVETAANEF